jgi:hypothetical protein
VSRRGARTHLGGNTKPFANAVGFDSTLAILGSITGNFDERVMELIGRIERPPGSRQGWRIPLPPQMATNSGQGIGKGGFGFGIPGSLPCWQMI